MSNRPVEVTVKAETKASSEVVFDVIVPIDLSSIFDRWGFIPGVEGVRDQTGPWDSAGRTRTVLLSDGTTAAEELTMVKRPSGFAYKVGPFPRPLGLIATHATGSWTFTSQAEGSTGISWTYSFEPARGRAWLVRLVIAPAWRRYAQRGLELAVEQVEAA